MLKTFDEKIAQIKTQNFITIPLQNTLNGIAMVEKLVFDTKPYIMESGEPLDKVGLEFALNGGNNTLIDF
jgi:hypothetical protein